MYDLDRDFAPLTWVFKAFYIAAVISAISLTQLLLDNRVNIKSRNKERHCTGLHFLIAFGHIEMVRRLLNKGANPDAKDYLGDYSIALSCTVIKYNSSAATAATAR